VRNLVLLSVVIGAMAIPVLSSMSSHSRRGLWRALSIAAVFNFIYLLALLYVYPHLN
jgi:predicted membrane-bound dolichyl-phosphate-mannose-protein mannosyltransferase